MKGGAVLSDGKYSGFYREGSPRRGPEPPPTENETTLEQPRRSAAPRYEYISPAPRHGAPLDPLPRHLSDEGIDAGRDDAPFRPDDRFFRPETHDDAPTPEPPSPAANSKDAGIEPTRSSLKRSLLLTTASALLPGVGLVGTKPRWARLLGVLAPVTFLACLGVVGYTALTDLGRLAGLAVNPDSLAIITALLIALAISWVLLVTATHLLTRPPGLRLGRRALGAGLVATLTFCIGAPLAVGARYALSSRDLVNSVFKEANEVVSTSRPTIVAGSNVWEGMPRLNIMLLGADSTETRKKDNNGVYVPRTDTIMVASIDTATGATTLVQIPRNVQFTPFPKGSKLAKVFPKGFTNPNDNPAEWYINAIWERTVNGDHPEMTKAVSPATYPGAEALKLGVEGITGLKIHYFALINIDGLQQLIDAMGGVTVNINRKIPIGGNKDAGVRPHGYLEPGPNRHLDGYHAMWYARSRYGVDDYDRMARQSCLVGAVIRQANPQTMLTSYEAIAKASKDMVMTDIPQDALQPIVELALKVKDADVTRLQFVDGSYGYVYGNPDFKEMRRSVAEAIGATGTATESAAPTTTAEPTSSAPAPEVTPTEEAKPQKPEESTQEAKPNKSEAPKATESEAPPAEVISDACAYHPEE